MFTLQLFTSLNAPFPAGLFWSVLGTSFQFQFPVVDCFYTVFEVKWLLIIDSKLSSNNNL